MKPVLVDSCKKNGDTNEKSDDMECRKIIEQLGKSQLPLAKPNYCENMNIISVKSVSPITDWFKEEKENLRKNMRRYFYEN